MSGPDDDQKCIQNTTPDDAPLENRISDPKSPLIPLADGDGSAYVILVPGITDRDWNVKEQWKESQPWLSEIVAGSAHKSFTYRYDLEGDWPQIFNRDGVESEALRLLECLVRISEDEVEEASEGRRFVFVMLDLGGAIVKKALTIACLDPGKYENIGSRTSTLIFVDYPHRASKLEHYEDAVGEFLSLNDPYPFESVLRIQNLARAVQEANMDFLDTNLLGRVTVCNVMASALKDLSEQEETAVSTGDDWESDWGDIEEIEQDESNHTAKKDDAEPEVSPTQPLDNHSNTGDTSREAQRPFLYYGIPCELTYNSTASHYDIVHGSSGLEKPFLDEIKAAISDSLRERLKITDALLVQSRAPPVYPPNPIFPDNWSTRWADYIVDSQEYKDWGKHKGLTILHVHGTSRMTEISQALMQRLNHADGRDNPPPGIEGNFTLYFEFNRRDDRFNSIYAMLAYFINVFFNRFSHTRMKAASSLLTRLKHHRAWSLSDFFFTFMSITDWDCLCKLTLIISRLDECDESRDWFLSQLAKQRIQEHGRVAWIVTSQNDANLKADIPQWAELDMDKLNEGHTSCRDSTPATVTSSDGSTSFERELLGCVQHAIRPLTVRELAVMMSLEEGAEEGSHSYTDRIQAVLQFPKPLVHMNNNDVLPVNLPLPTDSNESEAFHAELARRCLVYLQDTATQRKIFQFCGCYNTLDQPPAFAPRDNLISYAVTHWFRHYSLAGDRRPFEKAVAFFNDRPARLAWFQAYHTLTHPLIRLSRSYLSALPMVSILGLYDLVEKLSKSAAETPFFMIDCGLAVSEAARNGHTAIVQLLMSKCQLQPSALRDAIYHAACHGLGGPLHELVKHASATEGFEWPSHLLCRVATLGQHETAKILLDAGIPTNQPNEVEDRSPLHIAALHGHVDTVKVLLAAGADLECRAVYDRTPLHAATSEGNGAIVKMLLDAGSDMTALDEDELMPLQISMIWGRTDAMEVLLKAGADPNCGKDGQDDPAWSEKPLLYCSRFGYEQGVKLLFNYNVELDCKSGKVSPLFLAILEGELEIARILLEKGADPNENPVGYDFLLLQALSQGDKSIEMVGLLLDHGARIEEEDNSSNWRNTVLTRAAGMDSAEMVEFLLKRGANVNHCGQDSAYPVYVAVWSGKFANARILVDAGADIDCVQPLSQWTPVIAAYDNAEILRYVLDKGANVNAVSKDGTCLHFAVLYNKTDVVKLLLTRKPTPDLEVPFRASRGPDEDDGYTALGLACDVNNAKFVRKLLETGVSSNHPSRLGKRPLDICVQSGALAAAEVLLEYRVPIDHTDEGGNTILHRISDATPRDLVRKLVNAGADPQASNKNGATPLEKAVESKNLAVAKYLLSKRADVHRCSAAARSLVHLACARNDLAMVQALVKAGADIQRADSTKGAVPLLTTILETWLSPDLELLQYLMDKGQLDVNRRGGYMDWPLNGACGFKHIPHVQYLLEHGANPNSEDSGGRRPLHLASFHPFPDILDSLLASNAQVTVDGQPPRDNMGRSPVHFAAVGGNFATFKRVSELYDSSELDQGDKDGWTPLFWALMNDATEIELVQHLLDHGADLWARVKSHKAEWSPLKLARYCGLPDAICELLTPDPQTRVVGSKGKEEHWDASLHVSETAAKPDRLCDSCRVSVRGIYYSCRACKDYDLCFRCFSSRQLFHSAHTEDYWDEIGPEYETTTTNEDTQTVDNWADAMSHTELDLPSQASDHGKDADDNDGNEAEIEDRDGSSSSDSSSSSDVEYQQALFDDDEES